MATNERWVRNADVVQIDYDRRQEPRGTSHTPEDDYVTLRRAQIERFLTEAGYEKEKPNA